MNSRVSLSPFGDKSQSVSFSCLRIEFVMPIVAQTVKVRICQKYSFISNQIQKRCAYFNQISFIRAKKTQRIDVINEKINIEVQPQGTSQIDLNTYQAFSLEKVPIYQSKQLIGFLCFKIEIVDKKIKSEQSLSMTQYQIRDFSSNLFTQAFTENQANYLNPRFLNPQLTKPSTHQIQQQLINKITYEEIKQNIDQISVQYDELYRETKQHNQQEQQIQILDKNIHEQQTTLEQLNQAEAKLDEELQKHKSNSPQLDMLLNKKLQDQYSVHLFRSTQFTSENPLTMSIPFSFNEYFSLYKN